MRFLFFLAVVGVICLLGVLLSVDHASPYERECSAKGGVYVMTRSLPICIRKDALINVEAK